MGGAAKKERRKDRGVLLSNEREVKGKGSERGGEWEGRRCEDVGGIGRKMDRKGDYKSDRSQKGP